MEPERMATLLGWVMLIEAAIIIVSLIWGYVTYDRLTDLNRRLSDEVRYTAGLEVAMEALSRKSEAVGLSQRGETAAGQQPADVAGDVVAKIAAAEQAAKDQGTVMATNPLFPNGERYALSPEGSCKAIKFNVLSVVYKDLATKRPVNHEVYLDYDKGCAQSETLLKELIADANLGRLVRDKAAAAGLGDVDLAKMDVNVTDGDSEKPAEETNGRPNADMQRMLEEVVRGAKVLMPAGGMSVKAVRLDECGIPIPIETQLDRVEAKLDALARPDPNQFAVEIDRLRQEVKNLTFVKDACAKSIEELGEEIKTLKQAVKDREMENELGCAITEELKRDLQRVNDEVKAVAEQRDELREANKALNAENDNYDADVKDMAEKAAALKQEITYRKNYIVEQNGALRQHLEIIAGLKKTIDLHEAGSKVSAEKLAGYETMKRENEGYKAREAAVREALASWRSA